MGGLWQTKPDKEMVLTAVSTCSRLCGGVLYTGNAKINFMKHRYGHADYYTGDEESFVTLNVAVAVPKSNTRPGTT